MVCQQVRWWQAQPPTPWQRLVGSGHLRLKRFFVQAAKTAPDSGLDPERFMKASTHWMRHTFVRQALVDGVPIEVVSELAGHASIDTTSIYSTQELARKIRALQTMRHRVAQS
ncbi:MAG: site-specific integrase [Rhodoferax sp.]|nr:site-specific integrase [Rhodoferax sp.]